MRQRRIAPSHAAAVIAGALPGNPAATAVAEWAAGDDNAPFIDRMLRVASSPDYAGSNFCALDGA